MTRALTWPPSCCSAILPMLPFIPRLVPSESQGVASLVVACLHSCIQSLGEKQFLLTCVFIMGRHPLPETLSHATPSKLPRTCQWPSTLTPTHTIFLHKSSAGFQLKVPFLGGRGMGPPPWWFRAFSVESDQLKSKPQLCHVDLGEINKLLRASIFSLFLLYGEKKKSLHHGNRRNLTCAPLPDAAKPVVMG